MFPAGIGFGELVVIAIVLLLVVGPKKLPDVAKEVGKGLKSIRRMSNQLRDSAEVDEIKRAVYGEPGTTPAWKRSVSDHLNGLMEDDEPARHLAPSPPPRTAGGVIEGTPEAQAGADEFGEHDDEGRLVPRAVGPMAAAAAAEAALQNATAVPSGETPPTAVVAAPATLPAASPGNGPTNGEQSA